MPLSSNSLDSMIPNNCNNSCLPAFTVHNLKEALRVALLPENEEARRAAENFLLESRKDRGDLFRVLFEVLLVMMQEIKEVIGQRDQIPHQQFIIEIRQRVATLQSAYIYLKNSVEKRWYTSWAVNHGQVTICPFIVNEDDRKFLRQNLFNLIRITYDFCNEIVVQNGATDCDLSGFKRAVGIAATAELRNQEQAANSNGTVTNGINQNISKQKLSFQQEWDTATRPLYTLLKHLKEVTVRIARRDLSTEGNSAQDFGNPFAEQVLNVDVIPTLQNSSMTTELLNQVNQILDNVESGNHTVSNNQDSTGAVITMLKSIGSEKQQDPQANLSTLFNTTTSSKLYTALFMIRCSFGSQEHCRTNNPQVMTGLIKNVLPTLENLTKQLVRVCERANAINNNVDATMWCDRWFEYLRLSMKCYIHSVYMEVNSDCANSLPSWMEIMYKIIQINIPQSYYDKLPKANSDTATNNTSNSLQMNSNTSAIINIPNSSSTSMHLKNQSTVDGSRPARCLKWALSVVWHFFHKHGHRTLKEDTGPVKADSEILAAKVAKEFRETYALTVTKGVLLCLNSEYIPNRIQNLVLNILNESCEIGKCFSALKEEMNLVLTRVCFPLVCFSQKDLSDWQEDPETFLRNELHNNAFGSYSRSPRTAAERFIKKVATNRTSAMVQPLLVFVAEILKGYDENNNSNNGPGTVTASQVDGALAILMLVPDVLMKINGCDLTLNNGTVKTKFELLPLLKTYVAKHLESKHGFLRWRAIETLTRYKKVLSNSSSEDVSTGFQGVVKLLLLDNELVVRVGAGINLRTWLEPIKDQKTGEKSVSSIYPLLAQNPDTVKNMLIQLVSCIQSCPCDDLPETLSCLASKYYGNLVFPFVGDLIEELQKTILNTIDRDDDDDMVALMSKSLFGSLECLLKTVEKGMEGDKEKLNVAFTQAGLKLSALIEKVCSGDQFGEYCDDIGALYAMVTKHAGADSIDQTLVSNVVLKNIHRCLVELEIEKFSEQNPNIPALCFHLGYGLEMMEYLYVPIYNLISRNPQQLLRSSFNNPMVGEFFNRLMNLQQLNINGDNNLLPIHICIGDAAGQNEKLRMQARLHMLFGKAENAPDVEVNREIQTFYDNYRFSPIMNSGNSNTGTVSVDFSNSNNVHFLDMIYDLLICAIHREDVEAEFVFRLLPAIFCSDYSKQAVAACVQNLQSSDGNSLIEKITAPNSRVTMNLLNGNSTNNGIVVSDAEVGLYLLQKLLQVIELLSHQLTQKITLRFKRAILRSILELGAAHPEFIFGEFFLGISASSISGTGSGNVNFNSTNRPKPSGRFSFSNLVGNAFQTAEFLQYMSTQAQRRTVMMRITTSLLNFFSKFLNQNGNESSNYTTYLQQNHNINLSDLCRILVGVTRQLIQKAKSAKEQHEKRQLKKQDKENKKKLNKDNDDDEIDSDDDDDDDNLDQNLAALLGVAKNTGNGTKQKKAPLWDVNENEDVDPEAAFLGTHIENLLGLDTNGRGGLGGPGSEDGFGFDSDDEEEDDNFFDDEDDDESDEEDQQPDALSKMAMYGNNCMEQDDENGQLKKTMYNEGRSYVGTEEEVLSSLLVGLSEEVRKEIGI